MSLRLIGVLISNSFMSISFRDGRGYSLPLNRTDAIKRQANWGSNESLHELNDRYGAVEKLALVLRGGQWSLQNPPDNVPRNDTWKIVISNQLDLERGPPEQGS